jgi:hypothetical protein
MNPAKRRSCNQEAPIQCNGQAIDLEKIRTQAHRLNYRAKYGTPEAQSVDWVEVRSKELSPSVTKQNAPSIEVRVGATYTVSVASDFDRTAFTDICKVLAGLCQ